MEIHISASSCYTLCGLLSIQRFPIWLFSVWRLNGLLTLHHLASLSFSFTTFDLVTWKIHTDFHGSCSKVELPSFAISIPLVRLADRKYANMWSNIFSAFFKRKCRLYLFVLFVTRLGKPFRGCL